MNIKYTPREKNISIANFLDHSLKELESLDYYIEDTLNRDDLSEILDEDLPAVDQINTKKALIDDIATITDSFFQKTKSKKIRLQLQIVEDDMCRLFHMDNNIQRLLCTYKGSGTQWLEESNLDRSWLGKGDNSKIVKDFEQIKTANEFDILILKGQKFAQDIDGAVHRSPPIEKSNEKRVLLKIDEYTESFDS